MRNKKLLRTPSHSGARSRSVARQGVRCADRVPSHARHVKIELQDDVAEPYTALLRQAVRTAAALPEQSPLPLGTSLPAKEEP